MLAHGLQRLLGRCATGTAERHFPSVVRAHRVLSVQLRLRLPVRLPAELLSDLCHEIAEYVEAPVRQAAVRSLHRLARQRAAGIA